MSKLDDLIGILTQENKRIHAKEADDKPSLTLLLVEAIHKALVEIKYGAPVNEFKDLAILHLIVDGASSGYSTESIRNFVMDLKHEESDNDND